jgi:hypothetical protein
MAGNEYKIWAWGEAVGEGVTGAIHVGVAGVAKRNGPHAPQAVANELLCSELAQALRLPCPPGFVVSKDGVPHFASLNFNLAGEDLPPANAREIVAASSWHATGITVFDVWILNLDRHNKNIAFDRTTKRIQIFDHSHAIANGFGITDMSLPPALDKHCLAGAIETGEHLQDWVERVRLVPDYFIKEAVCDAVRLGYDQEDRTKLEHLLLSRRDNIASLIAKAAADTPNLSSEIWAMKELGR